MRLCVVVPAAAAVAAAVLAAPASAGPATAQVNVVEGATGCHLTLSTLPANKRLILFHIVNNSSIPRGIMIKSAKSSLALANGEADLYFRFAGPGSYPIECTANSYSHPTIIGRGTLRIGASGHFTIVPDKGGGMKVSA